MVDLERIYDAQAQPLYALLLNITRSEADTRDLLQEVFIKLARQPDLLKTVRDERAFLMRMAHNLAVDLIRRRVGRETTQEQSAQESSDLFVAESNPDENTFRAELAEALAALPPEQRTVVHLKLWEDMTFDRIAEVLDISINTAASRYRYGLDKLRDHLRPIYKEIQ